MSFGSKLNEAQVRDPVDEFNLPLTVAPGQTIVALLRFAPGADGDKTEGVIYLEDLDGLKMQRISAQYVKLEEHDVARTTP